VLRRAVLLPVVQQPETFFELRHQSAPGSQGAPGLLTFHGEAGPDDETAAVVRESPDRVVQVLFAVTDKGDYGHKRGAHLYA